MYKEICDLLVGNPKPPMEKVASLLAVSEEDAEALLEDLELAKCSWCQVWYHDREFGSGTICLDCKERDDPLAPGGKSVVHP